MLDRHIKIYARRGIRNFGDAKLTWGAILATIDVPERDQQKGYFGEAVDLAESLVRASADLQYVLIECVSNEYLVPYLNRRGYQLNLFGSNGLSSCNWFGDYVKMRSELI